MEKIIEIQDLKKSFGKKQVLENLNLTINKGENVAILGSNGCGKTTLVELIAQTSKPSAGSIKIFLENDVKKEIGIQFQQGEWPKGINAQDMLKFYRSVYSRFTKEWEKKLNDVFQINEFRNRSFLKLSGGEKQRFNAMISMLNNPQIVILDELTTGLDMQLQFQIIDFFKKETETNKKTLLLVSHSPEEVELLCNRLILIHKGKIGIDMETNEAIKKYGSVRKLMDQHFEGTLKYDSK